MFFVFLSIRPHPGLTRTDTFFPHTRPSQSIRLSPELSGAVSAATAPRVSSSGREAGDQLFRYGSNFGGVGGLSAIAAYNSAERAAVQLDNVDTPHVAPEFVLIGKRPDRKSTRLNSSHSCASRMPSSVCKKTATPALTTPAGQSPPRSPAQA